MVSTFTVLDFSLALISVVIETQHLKTWKNHNNLPPRWMQSTREMLASWRILHPSLASGREIARRWLAYFQQRNHITRPPRVARSLCRSTCFLSDEDRTGANAKLARSTAEKPRKSVPLLPDCLLPHPIHLALRREQDLANHNPQWHKSLSNYPKATKQTPKMLCCDAKILQIVRAKRSWFLNNTT